MSDCHVCKRRSDSYIGVCVLHEGHLEELERKLAEAREIIEALEHDNRDYERCNNILADELDQRRD